MLSINLKQIIFLIITYIYFKKNRFLGLCSGFNENFKELPSKPAMAVHFALIRKLPEEFNKFQETSINFMKWHAA